MATYSLAQWRSEQAQIRIPRDLWEAKEWVFEVVASLRPADAKACSLSEQDTAWITISPETSLIVPYQEQAFEGVASFFDEVKKSALPSLTIENPSVDQLALVATILYPFVEFKPYKSAIAQRQWKVVDEQACASQPCIQVKSLPPADSPLKLSKGQWRKAKGELHVPYISLQDTAGLFYLPKLKEQPSQLVIVPGETSSVDSIIDPPNYVGFIGRIALFAQRWHVLDIRLKGQQGGEALLQESNSESNKDKNISKEQASVRWLNFLWAGLSVLIVAAVIIRLWRRPASKKPDENWETHP